MRTQITLRIRSAFTLIELLIVVAIIAILAAIAVPNFLEAQTRSKVSRAKADMRSLATAIESYHVDHNEYPAPANEDGEIEESPRVTEAFENRLSYLITTPISYMTSLINEPFPAQGDPETAQFHYTTKKYFYEFDIDEGGDGSGGIQELEDYVLAIFNTTMPTLEYFILSHGPDADHDDPDEGVPALYDPTNGTVSSGDIIYWGPGTGFKN